MNYLHIFSPAHTAKLPLGHISGVHYEQEAIIRILLVSQCLDGSLKTWFLAPDRNENGDPRVKARVNHEAPLDSVQEAKPVYQ